MQLSDKDFELLIAQAMDELPQEYIGHMDNVAVVYADDPTSEQLMKQGVRRNELLLGLYEGIPLTSRYSSSYSGVLPDKITLFKNPILAVTHDDTSLREQIKRTLWHEIAHHYGLNHDDIHDRQDKSSSTM
jgi:predicted Zn-dependent protease with MMP-like domain